MTFHTVWQSGRMSGDILWRWYRSTKIDRVCGKEKVVTGINAYLFVNDVESASLENVHRAVERPISVIFC